MCNKEHNEAAASSYSELSIFCETVTMKGGDKVVETIGQHQQLCETYTLHGQHVQQHGVIGLW